MIPSYRHHEVWVQFGDGEPRSYEKWLGVECAQGELTGSFDFFRIPAGEPPPDGGWALMFSNNGQSLWWRTTPTASEKP